MDWELSRYKSHTGEGKTFLKYKFLINFRKGIFKRREVCYSRMCGEETHALGWFEAAF